MSRGDAQMTRCVFPRLYDIPTDSGWGTYTSIYSLNHSFTNS